ncbi:MAG: guanylate kinase [Candidatus Omnitrophica bacterium]|nr:guanylate kinase [Candidatus Omnitrophota bacterium]
MNESEKKSAADSLHSRGSSLFMVVSAPSGTGKTSICREFVKLCPDIRFSVSSTTRPPRPGEKNGVDYNFISEAAFREQIKTGAFAEWSENYGYYYGTAKEIMQNLLVGDRDLLLDIEPVGAKTLRNHYPGGVFVFVLPPSLEALKSRLNRRGELPEVMKIRLGKAMDEIKEIIWYDYIIINQDLQDAVDCLRSIYRAEKCRRERSADKIRAFFG